MAEEKLSAVGPACHQYRQHGLCPLFTDAVNMEHLLTDPFGESMISVTNHRLLLDLK